MRSLNNKVVQALAICIALGLASPGRADLIFNLNTANSAITGAGFIGPYVQVDVHLVDSTHATFTYTSLTAPYGSGTEIYLMGDGGSVGANINAASFNVPQSSVTYSNSGTGFSMGSVVKIGSGTEDGFGTFNLSISSFDGFMHAADTISFTVHNTSGTWNTENDVLTPQSSGARAAAHIFPTAYPAVESNGTTVTTGYAVDIPQAAPEPASIVLAGMGIIGAAGICRWRRGKAA